MQDTRKRQIRIEADSFREKCRVGRYGIIDLFSDCERAGYILMQYPLGVNADLGFTLRRDQDIIIFTNSCSRLSREIFTLAHEIGHAVIHLNGSDSFVDTAYTLAEKNTDDKEQEANYFAANLLMPMDEVDRFLDLEVSDFENKGLSRPPPPILPAKTEIAVSALVPQMTHGNEPPPKSALWQAGSKNFHI